MAHDSAVHAHEALTLAPALSSSCAICNEPLAAAKWSAVQPLSSRVFRMDLLPSVDRTACTASRSSAGTVTEQSSMLLARNPNNKE